MVVTAAVRQQCSGVLLTGVNQELGEQRREQSLQDCVAPLSGHFAGERDQLCEQHEGGGLFSALGETWASLLCSGASRQPREQACRGWDGS